MDWFAALEPPTQVAIVGVLVGLISAASAVVIAIINNRRNGGGKAEIAAMTIDTATAKQVAAAIEGYTSAQIEANMLTRSNAVAVDRLAKAAEELGENIDKLKDEIIRSAAKLK